MDGFRAALISILFLVCLYATATITFSPNCFSVRVWLYKMPGFVDWRTPWVNRGPSHTVRYAKQRASLSLVLLHGDLALELLLGAMGTETEGQAEFMPVALD